MRWRWRRGGVEHLCATAADVLNHAVQSGGTFETEMARWARKPTVFTIDLVGRPQKLKYLLGEFAPFVEPSAPKCFLGRFHALTLEQTESNQRAKMSHFASLEEARTCWKNWTNDTRDIMAEIRRLGRERQLPTEKAAENMQQLSAAIFHLLSQKINDSSQYSFLVDFDYIQLPMPGDVNYDTTGLFDHALRLFLQTQNNRIATMA
jgi:hypothetical protein